MMVCLKGERLGDQREILLFYFILGWIKELTSLRLLFLDLFATLVLDQCLGTRTSRRVSLIRGVHFTLIV